MAVQKCKKILLQATLRDHWSSDNPKLKTLKFVKNLTSLGSYWKKIFKNRDSWELRLFESDLKYCSTVNFQKKAELRRSANLLNALNSSDGVIKSSDHFLVHFATITSILMN